jgi:hypothetical protein
LKKTKLESNNEEKKSLSTSLVETITNPDLKEIGGELLEVGIDQILADGVLKEIPIVNVAVGIWKTGTAIRDHRFLSKLLQFLNESAKLSEKQREKLIENLEDDEYQKDAGERLIAIIDNLETKSKAKLVGKAIYLFGNAVISREEFWRISFIIEKLPMNDIYALSTWRETDLNKVEHIRKHLYLSVGLGWFVLDASSTGFVWTERLCEIISDNLLAE